MIDGTRDSVEFRGYVEQALVSTLRPDDVVVMDNLSPHKTQGVQQAVEAAGAAVCYLPPCSPDFNPIESMWSKVKAFLPARAARTQDRLLDGIGNALRSVTPEDRRGWFRGYEHVATHKARIL